MEAASVYRVLAKLLDGGPRDDPAVAKEVDEFASFDAPVFDLEAEEVGTALPWQDGDLENNSAVGWHGYALLAAAFDDYREGRWIRRGYDDLF